MSMRKSLILVLGFVVLLGGGLPACRTVSGALGSRDAELRTGQWWAGPIPDATPIKPQDRTAWVSYRNVTQEQGYDLANQLRQGLQAQGYTITEDPDQANFHVFYTLRFFGENGKCDEGRSPASALGGITGGLTGAAIANAAGGGTGAMIGAGAGGALLGAVVGTAVANYSQVIEYDLIMDVRIAQRKKGIVTRTTTGVQRNRQATAKAGSTGGGVVAGGRTTALDTRQELQEADNMLWQENRLVLWAKQIRLQPAEAKPSLERAMVGALPQILP